MFYLDISRVHRRWTELCTYVQVWRVFRWLWHEWEGACPSVVWPCAMEEAETPQADLWSEEVCFSLPQGDQ